MTAEPSQTTALHPVLEAALARMEGGQDQDFQGGLHFVSRDGQHAYSADGLIADEYVKANPGLVEWAKVPDLPSRRGLLFHDRSMHTLFDSHLLDDSILKATGLADAGVTARLLSDLMVRDRLRPPEVAAWIRARLACQPDTAS